MFADKVTNSIDRAIGETDRRRAKQTEFNLANGITPETIRKNVADIMAGTYQGDTDMARVTAVVDTPMVGANLEAHLKALRQQMFKAAENLEFEEAARIRDEIKRLETVELTVAEDPLARQSKIDEAVADAAQTRGEAASRRAGSRKRRRRRR